MVLDRFLETSSWQVHIDARAIAQAAISDEVATRLLDEAIHHAQAKPAAATAFLGREKRLEGTRQHIRRHAEAGVADRDDDVSAGCKLGRALGVLDDLLAFCQ